MKMLLYIDPGTGSMLFTILIGLLGTGLYLLRNVLVKLRFLTTGGRRTAETETERTPFAVFAESKRYWNSFEPICDEFERRGESLLYLTGSPDDPALEKPYAHVTCSFIGEGNRGFAKLNFLKADVLLATTPGLEVYQWKRSRDVKWYVHVLHMANDPTTYRMFGLDYYDALLLSGEYQVRQQRELEKLRALPPKEILLAGVPYLDALEARLKSAPPLPPHPTTVLLAPSWGASAMFSRYGASVLEALVATGYHIIVRPHPQSFTSEKALLDKLMRDFPDSGQLEWNRDNDNFEALRRSDVLLSDFSGVIFDFALVFGRPVIYADTSFDKAPYDACWLEEELWTFRILPKLGRQLRPEDLGSLKSLIDSVLTDSDYREGIEQARAETWACRGESAARIVDYMLAKRRELCPEESETAAAPV